MEIVGLNVTSRQNSPIKLHALLGVVHFIRPKIETAFERFAPRRKAFTLACCVSQLGGFRVHIEN